MVEPFANPARAPAIRERLLKKRNGEIVTGKFGGLGVERITISELLHEVETDYEENERGSLPQLKSRLTNHLIPAFGDVRAVDFGTDDLNRYRSRRLRQAAQRPRSTVKWRS